MASAERVAKRRNEPFVNKRVSAGLLCLNESSFISVTLLCTDHSERGVNARFTPTELLRGSS